jgi:hypothetical protein
MAVLYLDTEKGALSIRSRIKNGSIVRKYTPNITSLHAAAWSGLVRAKTKPDAVVIDTLTTLATTVRLDVVIDPRKVDGATDPWENRGLLTASQRDWGEMSDLIIRDLRMIRDNETEVPSVFVCHEGDREDPTTDIKKDGPDLNKMLLRDVYALSDLVVRIYLTDKTIKDKQDVVHPAGSRVLRIKANPASMAKCRFPDDVPEPDSPLIFDPTWEKLVDTYGGTIPERVLLYGPSGVGKTRFIGSMADYYAKQLEKKPNALLA